MNSPATDREIELKLLTDPAHLTSLAERLRQSPLAYSQLDARFLESLYFDTADRRLHDRGVVLRVRRVGERCIQTLKAKLADGGAHSVRGEWECEVEAMLPALERITDPEALDRLGVVLPEELALLFRTRVERRVMLVEQPVPGAAPAIIEVAFDDGAVETETAKEPITEVELELKTGSTRGLYLLVRELRQWAPLRISTADKARRGYRLAAEAAPEAVRAGRLGLDPEASVGEALGHILRACLGQWLENLAAAADGRDIEGVHQLRVAIRRCRSALSLFTEAIGAAERRRWNDRLKAIVAATGPARDLDVFLAETLPAIATAAGEDDAAALAAVEARARAVREKAYADTRRFLDGREHADLGLDFADWIGLEGWHETVTAEEAAILASPVTDLARRLLEKRHRKVRKLGRHFSRLNDMERHEVRLALKKLRYGVEFLGGLFPGKAARRYAKAAAELQDLLGQANDRAGTRALLNGLAEAAPARPVAERLALERGLGFILGWQEQTAAAQRREADAAWAEFAEQRPFWHDGDDFE